MENTISSSTNNPENSAIHYVGLSGENISQEQTVKFQASYSICKQNVVVSKRADKPFLCETCGQKFVKMRNLNIHKKIHTGDKQFKCHKCEKKYTQKSHLNAHLIIHTAEKKHKCDTCEKEFHLGKHLREHIRTHTGEKPFVCEICEQSFSQSSNLKRHSRTHNPEKYFKCDGCQKKFTRKSNLENHKKSGVCKGVENPVSDKQVTSTEQKYAQVQMQTAGNFIATGVTIFCGDYPEERKNREESGVSGQDQAVSSPRLPTPPMPTQTSKKILSRAEYIKIKKPNKETEVETETETETRDKVSLPVLSSLLVDEESVDQTMLETSVVESNSEQPLDLSLPKKSQNSSPYGPWETSTSHATADLNQGASASGNPAGYMNYQQIETSPTSYTVQNGANFLC